MNSTTPIIEVSNLTYAYGKQEAVHDLSFRVEPGRCYGLFGRNGAGKTTTIRCLLGLLRPQHGRVQVLGLDPRKDEVQVKRRLAYVPDSVAFYPWMNVRETLDYLASFRDEWNTATERSLLDRFELDERQTTASLSKGQKTQLALVGAICAEPELLVLDEPTSGLDPIVRREFIETVIGAFQEADPENRTILVCTHLISEFEGLIDEFTILRRGRNILTLPADEARSRYRKISARFGGNVPEEPLQGALHTRRQGRDLEVIANGEAEKILGRLRALGAEDIKAESLTLEEVFVATSR